MSGSDAIRCERRARRARRGQWCAVVSAEHAIPEKFHDGVVAVVANVVPQVQSAFVLEPGEAGPTGIVQMIFLMEMEVPPDGQTEGGDMKDEQRQG